MKEALDKILVGWENPPPFLFKEADEILLSNSKEFLDSVAKKYRYSWVFVNPVPYRNECGFDYRLETLPMFV